MASRVQLSDENILQIHEGFKMFQEGSFPTITLRVTLKNGNSYEVSKQFPKGHARNPFEWEDVEHTFRIGAEMANSACQRI